MTRPNVAVICAFNHVNAGMISVDLAAEGWFGARDCDFQLYMAAPTAIKGNFGSAPIGLYESPEQLARHSHVVFWGDFLTNPAYGREDFSGQMKYTGRAANAEEALALWRRLFLLQGDSAPTLPVAVVGGNFQHDFARMGDGVRADLEWLGHRTRLILPRDEFSLVNLGAHVHFDDRTKVHQGVDAAFLLPPGELRQGRGTGFACAFGRSRIEQPDAFIANAAEASGEVPLPIENWLNLRPQHAREDYNAVRAKLAGARFALTDIYHFAVNAINVGVPTIVLARKADRQYGTLGDFKKHTMLELIGHQDRIVTLPREAANDAQAAPAVAKAVAALMAEGDAAMGSGRLATLNGLRAQMSQRLDTFLAS